MRDKSANFVIPEAKVKIIKKQRKQCLSVKVPVRFGLVSSPFHSATPLPPRSDGKN